MCDALAVAHPRESASSYLSFFAVSRRFSLQPSCHLAVVPLSSLVVLSLVISSSVASFSSASSCDAAACRSLVLAASFAFRRNSVLLAAYPGPSSLTTHGSTNSRQMSASSVCEGRGEEGSTKAGPAVSDRAESRAAMDRGR